MTIKELEKKMLEHVRWDNPDATLETMFESIKESQLQTGISFELQEAIEHILDICITEINSVTNDSYYTQVDYYSNALKKNIVLDTDWYMGSTTQEFFEGLIKLEKERKDIEKKLQVIK